ncbi:hypothetical protein [Phycicoccus sp.]|uniref:hypothetical protein n=1 Tax=Phycicoccus sp. TaxID=1902410 RepID=UPI002BEF0CF2|nr:hypothetical protein [Phycicoccus sp.]HMM95415.1 hypothetical protein [Phycicoccus sp.]
MSTTDLHAKLDSYGVSYEGEQAPYVETEGNVTLSELAARGGRIVKVRWIGGDFIPGRGKCYDLSYIHGEVPAPARPCRSCDGTGQLHFGAGENFGTTQCHDCDEDGMVRKMRVRIEGVNVSNLTPRREIKGELIRWAKAEGVFAKGVGLLDDAVFSILG